jgi:hypothetical protein
LIIRPVAQRIIYPILVQNTNLNTLQNTLGVLQGILAPNTFGVLPQNTKQNTKGVLQQSTNCN